MAEPAGRLGRIRSFRAKPVPDWSISGMIEATVAEAQRREKNLGELTDLWIESLPTELASRTKLLTFRGGVLNVAVDSSSTMYQLDRLLREGLEAKLRAQYRGSLSRVRLSVGLIDDAGETKSQKRRDAEKKKAGTTDQHS